MILLTTAWNPWAAGLIHIIGTDSLFGCAKNLSHLFGTFTWLTPLALVDMPYYHLLDFHVFHCLFHQQFFPLRGTKHCLLYYESYTGKSKSKKLWLKLSKSIAQLFIKLFAFTIQNDSVFDIVSPEESLWWVRGKTT